MEVWKKFSLENTFSFLLIYSKVFGFITFVYPSKKFKLSFIGIVLFILNFSFCVFQLLIPFIMLDTEQPKVMSAKTKYSENKLITISLMIALVSSMFTRLINLLVNAVSGKRIFNVIKDIHLLDIEVTYL